MHARMQPSLSVVAPADGRLAEGVRAPTSICQLSCTYPQVAERGLVVYTPHKALRCFVAGLLADRSEEGADEDRRAPIHAAISLCTTVLIDSDWQFDSAYRGSWGKLCPSEPEGCLVHLVRTQEGGAFHSSRTRSGRYARRPFQELDGVRVSVTRLRTYCVSLPADIGSGAKQRNSMFLA